MRITTFVSAWCSTTARNHTGMRLCCVSPRTPHPLVRTLPYNYGEKNHAVSHPARPGAHGRATRADCGPCGRRHEEIDTRTGDHASRLRPGDAECPADRTG